LKTEIISTNKLAGKPSESVLKTTVLENEVKDVLIEFISIKGNYKLEAPTQSNVLDVLLTISGEGQLHVNDNYFEINSSTIARIPFNQNYNIQVKTGKEFSFIRLRKLLDKKDVQVIKNKIDNFDTLYIKALADCPTYKEDIKSDKTLNRMILPEGLVPRFAMGSVETEGPDEVGEHDHPMLDQIFFGLKGCKCSCFANGKKTVLTENMMLHIPLASKHYVSVAEGDKLAYIWMDFFLTLEGEKYMGEQHQVEEE
jgi:quercetin dioxygenase-like cupin family protein